MTIFWPGLIIGPLLIAACIFGFKHADFLSKNVAATPREAFGGQKREKTPDELRTNKGFLMIPIFGGMALGAFILIGSLTGMFN